MARAMAIFEVAASEPVQKGPPRAIKRMRMSAFLQQSSATVTVGLEPGFEFVVFAEASHFVPAIEVTASSLWNLFQLVNRDLESTAKPPRRAKVRHQDGAGREPRGPHGKREYWDGRKQRWVQKELQSDGKYRVLTRRATPIVDGDLEGSEASRLYEAESPQPCGPLLALSPPSPRFPDNRPSPLRNPASGEDSDPGLESLVECALVESLVECADRPRVIG